MSTKNKFSWKEESHILSSIKVAIKRHSITNKGPTPPIERRLGDPKELIIHYRPENILSFGVK